MQFWLAHHSEVPIHEQLVTQIVLGILSGDLRPGRRLPSTREMARRFHVHSNTVSAAYRRLKRDHWVEFRHGSGVYVRRGKPPAPLPAALALDQLIGSLFRSARDIGVPFTAVRSRLQQWLAMQPPDHFLLIEPDVELRRIAAAEMGQVVTLPIMGCGMEACSQPGKLAGAVPVVLPSKAEAVRRMLPAGTECLALSVRSVPDSLAPWLPGPADSLVGIASRWQDFLKSARTILAAAGLHADSLVFRDARKRGWEKGLGQTTAVVCDSLTATRLPAGCRAIPFPLLSESSLAELRRYQEFISHPLA